MTRSVQVGSSIVDSFSVISFEDGFSKVTGQTVFTATVWKDSVVWATSVTIAEIGTSGEYRIELDAGVVGFLKVQVLVGYNRDIWEWDFDVIEGDLSDVYEMLRRVLGLSQENIFIDNTEFGPEGQLIASRVRLFDTKANCDAATDGGSETTGLLATYDQDTVWEAVNQFRTYRQAGGP